MRVDYIFSYWVFLWFLLYYFHFTNYNPKLMFQFALIYLAITLIYAFLYFSWYNLIKYFLINFSVKVIPYLLIIHTKIKLRDIYATFTLIFIYLAWLFINDKSLLKIYKRLECSFVKKKCSKYGTFVSEVYDKIYHSTVTF